MHSPTPAPAAKTTLLLALKLWPPHPQRTTTPIRWRPRPPPPWNNPGLRPSTTTPPTVISSNSPAAAPQSSPERPHARRPPLPRRHAHPGIPRYLPRRCRARRRAAPARVLLRARPPRPRPRHVAARRRRLLFLAVSEVLSSRAGRSPQSEERPPHHQRHLPHRRRRPARSRRQNHRSEAGLRGCSKPRSIRPPTCSRCPSPRASPTRSASSSLCCCALSSAPPPETRTAKSMETRFFAPASLVSNLDFVEGIFGNAGDPYLPENDAALDAEHWSGHTGCVILAPHLVGLKKKALGLPHFDDATELQRRDGMCWRDETNSTTAARPSNSPAATARRHRHHHCRQLLRLLQERSQDPDQLRRESLRPVRRGARRRRHRFPAYVLGQEFYAGRTVLTKPVVFEDAMSLLGDRVELKARALRRRPLIPTSSTFPKTPISSSAKAACAGLITDGTAPARAARGRTYVLPWGTKIRLEKQPGGTAWRLIASRADGILCHKPCTVSGGGKSEISKSLGQHHPQGPVFVGDYHRDIARWPKSSKKDFSNIYKHRQYRRAPAAHPEPERSLGSVIKLLTPSAEYTDEHNAWLHTAPTIRQLLVTVKRYYRPEWGDNWQKYFTVDRINGMPGPRAQIRQPEAGRQLPARRLRSRRFLAHLQAAARLQSRRQSAGGRRHHRVRRPARRKPE
jgi:hypothetical protein